MVYLVFDGRTVSLKHLLMALLLQTVFFQLSQSIGNVQIDVITIKLDNITF